MRSILAAALTMGFAAALSTPSYASAVDCVGGNGTDDSYQTCTTVEGKGLRVTLWQTSAYSSLGGQNVYAYFYVNGKRVHTVKKYTGAPKRLATNFPGKLPRKYRNGTRLCNVWSVNKHYRSCITVHR
ncbi:hypothetical protein [Streptomyces sp. Ru73]|uniref:hypothetical protein n=1 Tax=Streptomyces sp. Ru73 TaxID=2080748 RepID=UPI0011B03168|nr:hypothetical protein [Streptomyces sp. Ru73]